LAGVDMAGFSAEGMNLRTMNLAAAEGIKGHQLNGALEIKNSTFPKDGTGFDQEDTHLEGVDFRASSVTGAQLNGHFGLIRASVGEMDMTGFHPRREVEETDLSRCNNLSGQQLDRVSSPERIQSRRNRHGGRRPQEHGLPEDRLHSLRQPDRRTVRGWNSGICAANASA
jgi:hypothetical protein